MKLRLNNTRSVPARLRAKPHHTLRDPLDETPFAGELRVSPPSISPRLSPKKRKALLAAATVAGLAGTVLSRDPYAVAAVPVLSVLLDRLNHDVAKHGMSYPKTSQLARFLVFLAGANLLYKSIHQKNIGMALAGAYFLSLGALFPRKNNPPLAPNPDSVSI